MLHFKLVVGLGNPGSEYAQTRHNSGFCVVDNIAQQLGVSYWKTQDGCLVATAKLDGQEVLLAKPQAFMNRSGGPLGRVMKRHELEVADILVVHDELDLPEGVVRLKRGGGTGGHNGLKSITAIAGGDYARVRVGIGRPPGRMDPADYVLAPMKKQQLDDFMAEVEHAAEVVLFALREGLDKAMQTYHS